VIIGLFGRKGSGKTTVAQLIADKIKAPILSFAKPLKEMIEKSGLCTYEELYANKTEFSRMILQKIGTNIFRNQIDRNFWIKRMKEEIFYNYKDCKIIIIDDVRFKNEARYVKSNNGKIVRVIRNDVELIIDNHESEMDCDLIIPDCIIYNNSSLEDLEGEVSMFIGNSLRGY